MIKYKRYLSLSIAILALVSCINISSAKNLVDKYIDPAYYESIPFGEHSHWVQPWRAYQETIPAHQFIDGIGVVFNMNVKKTNVNPNLITEMLARYGVKQARIEINWNQINYEDETQINYADEIRTKLLALQKQNIRPLVLLNASQGGPCPMLTFRKTLSRNANAGDTKIRLEDTRGIEANYSGLSNMTKKAWAAEILITEIDGNWVTLSKPLPDSIDINTKVNIATLKYRPFSPPDTADYQKTVAGWQNYVGTVTRFVTETLGTTNNSDRGFDLEIWNELSFASDFLYINKYYDKEIYKYKKNSIWQNLVTETINYVEAHSQDFQGIEISNGFSNTTPWPASSQMPPRIVALNKHPYRSRKYFPQQEYKGSQALDALGNETQFTPTYSIWFPEYFATFLQTETILRDIAPFPSEFGGVVHGRNARVVDGEVLPMTTWITEVNIHPQEDDADVTEAEALALKAKAAMRYFCFYLNKGVERVYLYNTLGGNKGYGIVQDNFAQYASQAGQQYPQQDQEYVSPTLLTTSRILAQMKDGLDPNLSNLRQLEVISIQEQHNNYQFEGDGSKAHPNLYNRELFTFLPYQVNENKFVIPYYIMTRDIKQDLPPENYQLSLRGFQGDKLQVKIYDPLQDRYLPEVSVEQKQEKTVIDLEATDYPYLLIVEEQ
ncbi:conserved exported hypothetical protein [Hyella patelloides LEGE 07179]|uniref:Uncharacterized protein n=1 Tax=Hyella patelloides LEGE 07179 TaxID=945734 RepID=A0A563VX02_9CYAN|nr:hypothetical protein [Hyella patelloides]VEP15946.1 conserved exported hypothetical protein [Hyella patelloides LEGE 07179]